jgi:peptide deformylase
MIAFGPIPSRRLGINLGKEIKLLKRFGIPIAVITNASLIDKEAVQNDLMEADWVSVNIKPIQKTYFNPEMIHYGEKKNYYHEGCLSIPDIFEDVLRPEKIEVRYRDEYFDWKEEVLNGIAARIFQYEFDHLQGILFIDKIRALRKKLIKGKLQRITRNQ